MTRALLRSVTPKVEGTEPREGGTAQRRVQSREANLHVNKVLAARLKESWFVDVRVVRPHVSGQRFTPPAATKMNQEVVL